MKRYRLLMVLIITLLALSTTIYLTIIKEPFKPEDLRWHLTIDGKEYRLKPIVIRRTSISDDIEKYTSQLRIYRVKPHAKIAVHFPQANHPQGGTANVTKDYQLVSPILVDGKVRLGEESGDYYVWSKMVYYNPKTNEQVALLFGCILQK